MTTSYIAKGLAGVYADTTRISKVFEDTNTLTYRGYPVQDLAAQCCFEKVAYLLWYKELPDTTQLQKFTQDERAARILSPALNKLLHEMPKNAHPMDALRTAISFMAMEDNTTEDLKTSALLNKSLNMLAKIPTIIANNYRIGKGLPPIAPRGDLSMAENFFYMYFGEIPEAEVVRCFDASLTFYAEHSFNASTFTARTIVSSLSDIYAGVTGAIGSLKGPLHGGANEAVMRMLLEIDRPDKAQDWIDDALATKKKVMGFGHRVYRNGDSRVPHMTKYFHDMATLKDGQKWVEIEDILSKTVLDQKDIHPNLDFPVGPAYYLMGFDIPVFTPIFVMSRITGWTAHIMEQLEDNKLIRPLAEYNGIKQRKIKRP